MIQIQVLRKFLYYKHDRNLFVWVDTRNVFSYTMISIKHEDIKHFGSEIFKPVSSQSNQQQQQIDGLDNSETLLCVNDEDMHNWWQHEQANNMENHPSCIDPNDYLMPTLEPDVTIFEDTELYPYQLTASLNPLKSITCDDLDTEYYEMVSLE